MFERSPCIVIASSGMLDLEVVPREEALRPSLGSLGGGDMGQLLYDETPVQLKKTADIFEGVDGLRTAEAEFKKGEAGDTKLVTRGRR